MQIARINSAAFPTLSSPFGPGGTVAMPALDDLSDVDLTGLADGDIIVYDLGSGTWVVAAGGAGGPFLTVINGGGDTVKAHGSTGATETFDPADGNVHTATLNANCTFTLTSPASGPACTIELYLTQDGTGSRFVTWPGSVVWVGGTAPTLSTTPAAVDRIILETLDGGLTWYGVLVGSGASITPATTDHEHINDIQFSGDGSTTAFELPAAPFDQFSVAAYVAGVRLDVTLSGTMFTTMTFGSAPASGTNNIIVDLIAAAA